jgi:SAM-dependent methyltransferase
VKPFERFTDRAQDYAVARPSYPPEAIDALFEGLGDPAALTVVDLGAGTGISSRLLAARGAATIAIEPNASMRERSTTALNLRWQDGSAEQTGLAGESADLVAAFQAFHWFDHAAALREIARILRPGGRLGVVYNERDESDAFTAAYGELVRRYATDETERRRSDGREAIASLRPDRGWQNARAVEIRNSQSLDRAGMHARARSTSYLPVHGTAADELHAAIDTIFGRYQKEGMVLMALKTIVSLAELHAVDHLP